MQSRVHDRLGLGAIMKGERAGALLADGVPSDEIYDVLGTPEGVTRALAKLDTIKAETIWWEAGAQPPQLLADGEVAMTTAYNGRIFAAAVGEGAAVVAQIHQYLAAAEDVAGSDARTHANG